MHNFPVHPFSQSFIHLDQPGEILPPSGGREHSSVHRRLHPVEVLPPCIQIGDDRRMNAHLIGVFFPDVKILFHIDFLDTVQGHHIKFTYRFIILRRVARRNDDPSLRDFLISECLALQELQHRWRQGLRDTVDLINEKNSLFVSGNFHFVIHRRDDLAHRILRHRIFFPSVLFFLNKRQPHCALAGMMGDRIRHQADPALSCHLLHDLCLSDSRRPHQKDRPLMNSGDHVFSTFILY